MAVAVEDKTESKLIEVAGDAMEAFGNDISTMFDAEVACVLKEQGPASAETLRKLFKKVCAVHSVQAEGTLDGTFHLIFDQAGLFTMAGVVVMLPEARVREEAKRGTDAEAKAMADAVGEVGNLLVGSWNRVFRHAWTGHKHFVKGHTFIGVSWDNARESIGLAEGEGLDLVVYEVTVGSYPPFSFAILFSKDLWAPKPQQPTETAPDQAEQKTAPASQEAAGPAEQAAAAPSSEGPKEESAQTPASTAEVLEEPSISPQQSPSQTGPEPEAAEPQVVEPQPAEAPAIAAQQPLTAVAGPIRQASGLLDMTVEMVMTKGVVWVTPDDSVLDVLRTMQQHDVGYAMVGHRGVLEGIVSRSNVLGAISPYLRPVFAKWRRPEDDATLNIKIKWAMTRPVQTIRAGSTLGQAIERMQQFGGRCLPVTAADGKVVGMLTVFDVLGVLSPNTSAGRTPQAPCLMA
jgi:CBS domain-containing protein